MAGLQGLDATLAQLKSSDTKTGSGRGGTALGFHIVMGNQNERVAALLLDNQRLTAQVQALSGENSELKTQNLQLQAALSKALADAQSAMAKANALELVNLQLSARVTELEKRVNLTTQALEQTSAALQQTNAALKKVEDDEAARHKRLLIGESGLRFARATTEYILGARFSTIQNAQYITLEKILTDDLKDYGITLSDSEQKRREEVCETIKEDLPLTAFFDAVITIKGLRIADAHHTANEAKTTIDELWAMEDSVAAEDRNAYTTMLSVYAILRPDQPFVHRYAVAAP